MEGYPIPKHTMNISDRIVETGYKIRVLEITNARPSARRGRRVDGNGTHSDESFRLQSLFGGSIEARPPGARIDRTVATRGPLGIRGCRSWEVRGGTFRPRTT